MFFKGFKKDQAQWTAVKADAWAVSRLTANAQASLFISLGVKVQKRPVLV